MTPLKIVHVVESGGGSGRHVADLAAGQHQRGDDVAVIFNPRRMDEQYLRAMEAQGVPRLVSLLMRRAVGLGDMISTVALTRALRNFRDYDVLHLHSSKAGALGRLIPALRQARIYTPHAFRTLDPTLTGPSYSFCRLIESTLRARTDMLICVSDEEAAHARELGYEPERIATICNGVRPVATRSRDELRRGLGLDADDVVFGFVGRFCHQKDPLRFAQAIALARHESPRIRGVMVGDGELRQKLEGAGCTLLGRTDACSVMPAFDALVCTSHYEGMPYIFAEALHAGLPIVSTAVGGARQAIIPGVSGYTCSVDISPNGLASLLTRLASDKNLLAALSRGALAHAQMFTLENMLTSTERAYRAALRRRRTRRPFDLSLRSPFVGAGR